MRQPEYVGSSVGIGAVLHLSTTLSDTQFRVLVTMSECPDGEGFSCSLDWLVSQGLDLRSAKVAVRDLARRRLDAASYQTLLDFNETTGEIHWRFFR